MSSGHINGSESLRSGSSAAHSLSPDTPRPAGSSLRNPEPSTSWLMQAFGKGHPALVAYVMAGYPTRGESLDALRVLAASGVDVIELGVPYGDALADGPTIVRAANEAMRGNEGGFGLSEAIELAEEFLADPGVDDTPPLALMTYYNPMLRRGLGAVASLAIEAGVAGFIVPDMPPDVAQEWLAVSQGLDTVFLVAPTSTPDRMRLVGQESAGFVYCVSTTGVTGERAKVSSELDSVVAKTRQFTSLPIAVGFGISNSEQAADVARIADGAVVGSAIVSRQHDLDELRGFVTTLAQAVHSARD